MTDVIDDEFQIDSADETALFFSPIRGKYRKPKREPVEYTGNEFRILDELQDSDGFQLVTPESFDALPAGLKKRNGKDSSRFKPICFVDGEGANIGDKTVTTRKHNLLRWVQKQNYALFGATLESDEYRCIIGIDNVGQLSTKQCLEFLVSLPSEFICIGYALTYDVEHWLKDLTPDQMQILIKTKSVFWRKWRIHYIPHKIFSVSRYRHKKRLFGRTVYDIFGFFQCDFKTAIRNWRVGTQAQWEFIDKMKALRPDFGPITEETKKYNKEEGLLGIEMFKRVREEYTKLELTLPQPVGAGSIASAMFRKHNVLEYGPTFQQIPIDTMLSGYFGGRFDVTRVGFIGNTFESDINSAYPHIARNLPCLRCGRFIRATEYDSNDNGIWLVRWKDNGTRWSPFPYRTESGHIRYYANGIGYYYGREVAAALRFDPTIDVLGGYRFEINCDHRPFAWLEDYYKRRQEMLLAGDFGDQIIKYGSNSVYGKLAQSKGDAPRYQNLIWAGMITSGTRGMLLDGIRQSPNNVIKVATDAIFSSVPLELDYNETELGAWKTEELYDLLVLGNGVYQSLGSSNPKHPNGVKRNRGFARDSRMEFDWDIIRENYRNGITSIVLKREFRRFVKAFHENKLEERCDWVESQVELKLDIQKQKRRDGEQIWPLANPTPQFISAPSQIDEKSLNIPGVSNSLSD